ncbi:4Fe-4S binding protein [Chloroflexota bacterium]
MRWGMFIDLTRCIGCYACSLACEFIGGLALRYSLLKGGVYASLIDA